MPPICALLSLELLAAVTAVVLEGILEVVVLELVIVLEMDADVDVDVDVVDVDVTKVDVELWTGRVVAVRVDVGVARTIDPDSTISVAINVACVSGAAPVWLLHIPYASVTIWAIKHVSPVAQWQTE